MRSAKCLHFLRKTFIILRPTIALVSSLYRINNHPRMDRRVFHIIQQVEENPGSDWNVRSMAANVNLTSSQISRLFSENLSMTPADFVRRVRHDRAVALLTDGFLSIKQISYSLGYRSSSHFSKEFRKRTGKTPLSFRKDSRCKRTATKAI